MAAKLWQPSCFYHSKTGFKNCPKNDHLNTGRSGIRWFTVLNKILLNVKALSFYKIAWNTHLNVFYFGHLVLGGVSGGM
jgi:hypothetical protein